MPKHRLIPFLILFCLRATSQLPETDLFMFSLKKQKAGDPVITRSVQITARPGYDNQPGFSADEQSVYYVSVREDKQSDVYCYSIKTGKTVQLSHSKESEYSPTLYPSANYLNVVTVESDSAQRIHFLNAGDGIFVKKLDFDSVGYFTFLNADTLVYYKLTEPHSLRYFYMHNGEDRYITSSPVRGFKAMNRHQLIYGVKDSSGVRFYTYDFLVHKSSPYAYYPSLSEDILWHPAFGLLKSEGADILKYDEVRNTWLTLFSLKAYGIKKITRFLIDSQCKTLIVVNNL